MIDVKILNEVCLLLSKSGRLQDAFPLLAKMNLSSLTPVDRAGIYAFIKARSGRSELEWRSDFAVFFGMEDPDLPPVAEEEFWGHRLRAMALVNDIHAIRAFLEEIDIANWDFTPERNAPQMPHDVYPLDDPGRDGLSPINIAEKGGNEEVLALLVNAREALARRYAERWKRLYA